MKIFFCFFVAMASLCSASTKLLPEEQNNVDIYKACSPSVVNITTVQLAQEFIFELTPQRGLGSGIIIKVDGNDAYVATNFHVIGEADELEVALSDKSRFHAKPYAVDPETDLAIIKISTKGKKLKAVEFADPDELLVGKKALAIGNPFGLGGTLTRGIISALGRDIRSPTTNRLIKDVIQTDTAINPGNSGGALLDSSGKLIGMNTQILSKSGGNQGIGFAISVKTLRKVIPQLIQYRKVLRPWLGIAGIEVQSEILEALQISNGQGVMIRKVYPNSPAHKSGLKQARERASRFRIVLENGDVIFQIDSTPTQTMTDILDYILEKKTGEVVQLHIVRDGKKTKIPVTLAYPGTEHDTSI